MNSLLVLFASSSLDRLSQANLSHSSGATNCIIFAQYVIHAFEIEWTAARQTTIAILLAISTVVGASSPHFRRLSSLIVLLVAGASTRWALRLINTITVIKLCSLALCVQASFANLTLSLILLHAMSALSALGLQFWLGTRPSATLGRTFVTLSRARPPTHPH